MKYKTLKAKFRQLYQQLNGCTIEYDLSPYRNMLPEINKYESQLNIKTDLQLQQLSTSLKEQAQQNQLKQQTLYEVFALVRETAWRVLKLRPFDEQILGALAMQQDKLAEKQTGEGKT